MSTTTTQRMPVQALFFTVTLCLALVLAAQQSASAQTTREFAYDAAGRVIRETITQGEDRIILRYTYDQRSNVTSSTTEVTTGVDEENALVVCTVQPNPSSGTLTITAHGIPGPTAALQVTSPNGDVLTTKQTDVAMDGRAVLTIDPAKEGFASGSYSFTVRSGSVLRTGVFVVTR